MKDVTLEGGTRDGETVKVHACQPLIYMTKKISIEEHRVLVIDDSVAWKSPEELYVKNTYGEFFYSKTVNYKPEEE